MVLVNFDNNFHTLIIVRRTEHLQGKEAARVLAIRGCTVVMCVRDKRRGDEAAAEIQMANPAAKLDVMVRPSRCACVVMAWR